MSLELGVTVISGDVQIIRGYRIFPAGRLDDIVLGGILTEKREGAAESSSQVQAQTAGK